MAPVVPATEALVTALNSATTADYLKGIACQRLKIREEDYGSATHFLQELDRIIPGTDGKLGLVFAWTMVSVTPRRAHDDFLFALQDVQAMARAEIERLVPVGTEIELFCYMALDAPVQCTGMDKPSTLVELPAIKVEGQAAIA